MAKRDAASDDIDSPWIGWALFLPAAAFLGAFTYYPALATLYESLFSNAKGGRPARFVGLDNYAAMVQDPIFWQALKNNAWFAVGTIPASIALAICMALLVNRALPGRSLLRMSYFAPTVLAMVAVANIWLFIFSPQIGLLNQVLSFVGVMPHNWLGQPDTALASVTIVAIWKEAGFFMIFYLAALQNMPANLSEAAAIEGASRWYYFWKVTFPLLMPTTLFVLVNAVVNSFRLVDHIIVMTKGGPDNASMLLLYYIYEIGFRFWDSAYAAALTMVLLLLLGVVALLQFWFLERKVHYQ
jgi:sn-glycerol 3-phosphate transport system permease protein